MAMTQPQGHQKGRGVFKQRVDVSHRKQRHSLNHSVAGSKTPSLVFPSFWNSFALVVQPRNARSVPSYFRIRDVILLLLRSGEIGISSRVSSRPCSSFLLQDEKAKNAMSLLKESDLDLAWLRYFGNRWWASGHS